jgi:hypothetical protein
MKAFHLLACIAVGLAFSSSPIAAQWLNYPTAGIPRTPDGKPNLSAPTPRTSDGKPDLSGLWEMERKELGGEPGNTIGLGDELVNREMVIIGSRLQGDLPYQPWAAQLVKTRGGLDGTERQLQDPLTNGLPVGPVRLHTYAALRKIIQIPGLVVILNELGASYRQIFTDGRPLPTDPNPTWNGYSTGRWDGDALRVQTNGLRDGTWLDFVGNPLTESAKITERFRRLNFGQLQIEITIDDPKAYTKPWTVTLNQVIRLNTDLLDKIMHENEKDLQHTVAK